MTKEGTVVCQNQVGRFRVYANEEYIGEVLKQGKIWDYTEIFNTLMPFIPHNKDILDIGSHIGCHAIPYARKTSGTVHCFDAQKEMYELLLDNVEMNKVKNVKAYNVAVGHQDGITVSIASTMPDGSAQGEEIIYGDDKPRNYAGMNLGQGERKVSMITIDSLNLSNVGYMKLDVQGSEPLVFYGARETIQRCRPLIYYETQPHLFQVPDLGIPIPEDAREFNIKEYTKGLGYLPPIQVGENVLLIPSLSPSLPLYPFERKVYSQNGEDGIIDAIFQAIGTTNKFYVEIGTESGSECNTRLLREKGWQGIMIDGKYENSEIGLYRHIVTPENVESLLDTYGVPKEMDLFSLDIDSNDFYVWQAIERYRPRVVVIEFNAMLNLWDMVCKRIDWWDGTSYFGASITAMFNLARNKGYSLVYCDSNGVNLFFVRDDCVVTPFESMNNPHRLYRWPRYGGHPIDYKQRDYVCSLDLL